MTNKKIAVFLGGVSVKSTSEREMAYGCGKILGQMKYTLFHGGYNGLMEDVAHGASLEGAKVFAITLSDKKEWGTFNPYVSNALYARDFGQRLNNFFSSADIVIAMGGGIGTLHEITSAIWYAQNIRSFPVIILGTRGINLIKMLKEQEWIYKSPTRSLDFLQTATSIEELEDIISRCDTLKKTNEDNYLTLLEQEVFKKAMVKGEYIRADGSILKSYFDPFRLSTDPKLLSTMAYTVARKIKNSVDAIAGVALGGVTFATYLASILDKPLLIIRSNTKSYGTYAQVEGYVSLRSNVLIVDDVVRKGTTIESAQIALKKIGLNVSEAVCILSYGYSGYNFLQKKGIFLNSLFVIEK